jgi:hypothetical protein
LGECVDSSPRGRRVAFIEILDATFEIGSRCGIFESGRCFVFFYRVFVVFGDNPYFGDIANI